MVVFLPKHWVTLGQTLREVERQHTREKLGQDEKGTDIHYLKNVILKLYETGAGGAWPLLNNAAC